MEFPESDEETDRTSGPKGQWVLRMGVRAKARTYPTANFSQPILLRVASSKQQVY